MFADYDMKPVGYASDWRTEKFKSEGSCQTEKYTMRHVNFQVMRSKTRETQTDESISEYMDRPEENTHAIDSFIMSVAPIILKELEFNDTSKAFVGYKNVMDIDEATSKLKFTFKNSKLTSQIPINALTWNKPGSVVAVAYGRASHETFCDHKGYIATWSTEKSRIDPDKPEQSIDVPSCVTAILFHPTNPALLIVGTFVGKIYIFDMTKEDDMMAHSSAGELAHSEPISQLAYVPEMLNDKNLSLLSSSLDGRLIMWRSDTKSKSLIARHGYTITDQILNRNKRSGQRGGGIFSFSLNPFDKNTLVVGSDSGLLFNCKLESDGLTVVSDYTLREATLYDAVQYCYSRHHSGPVTGVSWSPFHHGIFLSCSADGLVSLYNSLQTLPVATFDCSALASSSTGTAQLVVRWSTKNPIVFTCCSQSGVYVFHLRRHLTAPIVQIPLSDGKALTSCGINDAKNHIIATGNNQGVARIWNLDEALLEIDGTEEEYLNNMAQITSD